jgi:hypothetical protein
MIEKTEIKSEMGWSYYDSVLKLGPYFEDGVYPLRQFEHLPVLSFDDEYKIINSDIFIQGRHYNTHTRDWSVPVNYSLMGFKVNASEHSIFRMRISGIPPIRQNYQIKLNGKIVFDEIQEGKTAIEFFISREELVYGEWKNILKICWFFPNMRKGTSSLTFSAISLEAVSSSVATKDSNP